jgi:hypothetical protein
MIEKKLNVGIQILRMIFSFHILVFHCINRKLYSSKIIIFIVKKVDIDLGVFFIMSFYYSYHSFNSKNIEKIKQRFYRLLIPYIIWPLFFFMIHNFSCYLNGKKKNIKSYLLYYQLLVGNGIHFVFWFQCHLIILSILFLIVIFASKKKTFIILTVIGVSLYIFLFSKYYKKNFSYNTTLFFSIRQLPLSYIYALFGFILFDLNDFVEFKRYKFKKSFICFIAFCLHIYNRIFLEFEAYSLMIKMLLSISVFIVFLNLPLHETSNNLIKFLTSYSGGIYYLHIKMPLLLKLLLKREQSRTITTCIIYYLLCYLLCFIGSKLTKKNNLRYLFI